ncbi:LTA synthase family protein [Solitalea koreensis]|uniref:Phosphoglycerol transferase MdoB n=1 Tax=Solitalea koreensis TaxID=543615 RepID=A0A521D9Y4_9SPHI|nr:alkaline phosphatase family protein [Solitalea koreensis]SMO68526.1 Phosphoglycerol transferase MdoB [Solitalea koreensis]
MKLASNRYSLLIHIFIQTVILSFLVRLALLVWNFNDLQLSFLSTIKIFGLGLIYDGAVATFFIQIYALYLLLLPQKFNNALFNKAFTHTYFFLTTLILIFSFFAEFTFWEEFGSRFNFIAVDYLIYTYEVVQNINQSYPLPLLIGGVVAFTLLLQWIAVKKGSFRRSFESKTSIPARFAITGGFVLFAILHLFIFNNGQAEWSQNRYDNELTKAGIYSFGAAFKNNELDYDTFYLKNDIDSAFNDVRKLVADKNTQYDGQEIRSIKRSIENGDSSSKPNVIMITIESFSADFLTKFGNKNKITPFLDSLTDKNVFFNNMYATGTRTVRGMEALSLSIPPTPGSSIVRRPNNTHLFTVGEIFAKKGYARSFIYGGDGYFDNMNQYFGGNGFDIIDRGRGYLMGDEFTAKRTLIADKDIHFENAWGICDEDIYDAVIRDADEKQKNNKPFFDFVMTTSNHRPYTYPANCIDIPSGSGRDGAVKYTDYAIRKFISKIQSKPWFKNTIIILVADHCASSAGKNEINVSKYHIPCWILNIPKTEPMQIKSLCSQIDLYPTLFSMLGWKYDSNLFGKNALEFTPNTARAFVGTYQKLGYMKNDTLVVLGPQQSVSSYKWITDNSKETPIKDSPSLVKEAVSYYQTANYLFKNGGLKK